MQPPAEPLVTALKARLFQSLSDVSRLTILHALSEGPLTVGEIVEHTGLSQSNVSNHLRTLSSTALVTSTPQGRYTVYQLSSDRVAEMLALADEVLHEAARGVYEYTTHTARAKKREE